MAQRYGLLDTIRGIAVISMVIYHGCYDLAYIFSVPMGWFSTGAAHLWQQATCWTFIFLAGFCWHFHRQPVKAGVKLSLWGLVITAVTLIFIPDTLIIFGILSFLGAAILLMVPLDKIFSRINPIHGFLVSFVIFVVLLIGEPIIEGFSANLTDNYILSLALAVLGFPGSEFFSTDYFPLIPWFFLFAAGYFFHPVSHQRGYTHIFSLYTCKPLAAVGRRALIIYLLHQPILYLVLYLFFSL